MKYYSKILTALQSKKSSYTITLLFEWHRWSNRLSFRFHKRRLSWSQRLVLYYRESNSQNLVPKFGSRSWQVLLARLSTKIQELKRAFDHQEQMERIYSVGFYWRSAQESSISISNKEHPLGEQFSESHFKMVGRRLSKFKQYNRN